MRLPPATCVLCITLNAVHLTIPERVTEIVGASTSCHGRWHRMTGLSRRSSNGVQSTPEANLSARSPLAWIDNSPLTSGLVFHLQTPCSDLERPPLFYPNRGGNAGSRLSAACRNVWSGAVWVVLAAAPSARVVCGQGWRQDIMGQGPGPGPAAAQNLRWHQVWPSARGVAGSWHRAISPALLVPPGREWNNQRSIRSMP
jgi:hypothetical protein